ncbi:MAG: hypothetical protein JSS68_01765 [Actinobacteria bacterium]|nr:hypothetical protein [Actinomycetota bacterium]
MSRSLARSRPVQPDYIQPDRVLSAQVVAAQRLGINSAVRIQGAAFASSVAMHHATMLSRSADAAFRASPMGEDAYRAIVGAFASVAVNEIQSLSFRGFQ